MIPSERYLDESVSEAGRRAFDAKAEKAVLAVAWQTMSDDLEEGAEARQQLPALKAEIATLQRTVSDDLALASEARDLIPTLTGEVTSLRRTLSRPVQITADIKAPAKAKAMLERPSIKKCLVAGVVAEFLRRTRKTAVSTTLRSIFPGVEKKLLRATSAHLLKAATSPGGTTNPMFGEQLAQHDVLSFWSDLAAISIAGSLIEKRLTLPLEFGGNRSLTVPIRIRDDRGSMQSSWVTENSTIPVVNGALTSTTLLNFKLGAISVFSSELARTSTPNIVSVIEDFILSDSAVGVDAKLFSDVAAVAGVSPAGLLNGITPLVPDADMHEDLKALIQAMATFRARRPVFVFDEMLRISLMMQRDANGFFFKDEMERGSLLGVPFIASTNAPEGQLIIMDAAAVYLALPVPTIDISKAATIVMADATGAAPSMAGLGPEHHVADDTEIQISDAPATSPPTVVRSLFQSNSEAIRIIHDGIGWSILHPSAIAVVTPSWA